MYFNTDPYRRRVAAFAAAVLVLCLLMREGGFAAERGAPPVGEYQVKAAFVYNFIKFVTWPSGEASASGAVRICILGDLPDAAPFDDLDGQEIMGKRLYIVHLKEPQEARTCQVLFLSASLSSRLPETLVLVRGRPVLTVGDTDGYAQRGVMINMYLENKRVRFEINTETAGLAGLRISTKLLSLAGTVYGTARTGK
jgi:hypothetical protein